MVRGLSDKFTPRPALQMQSQGCLKMRQLQSQDQSHSKAIMQLGRHLGSDAEDVAHKCTDLKGPQPAAPCSRDRTSPHPLARTEQLAKPGVTLPSGAARPQLPPVVLTAREEHVRLCPWPSASYRPSRSPQCDLCRQDAVRSGYI